MSAKIIDFPTAADVGDGIGPSITVHFTADNQLESIDVFDMEDHPWAVKSLLERALRQITEDTSITAMEDPLNEQ